MPIHSVRLPGLVAHQEVHPRRPRRDADDPPRHDLARGVRAGGRARARASSASFRRGSPSGSTRCSERPRRGDARFGELELSLLRPREPEALIDEEAFADDEFMPYWAELWPSGLSLAGALPDAARRAAGASSSAAGSACPRSSRLRRGARGDRGRLGRRRRRAAAAERGAKRARARAGARRLARLRGLVRSRPRRRPALRAAQRRALLELLPALAPEVLLAEPGRPPAAEFFTQRPRAVAGRGDRRARLPARAGAPRGPAGSSGSVSRPAAGARAADRSQAPAPEPVRAAAGRSDPLK